MRSQTDIPSLARGRWREILPALGIDPTFLTNRHGPCPGCGGRDRFRFDDKDGRGTFVCGGGGDTLTGDGFDLLQHAFGWGKAEAFRAVGEVLGLQASSTHRTPAKRPMSSPDPAPKRDTGAYGRALWARVCRDDAVVAQHPYCQAKGISWAAGAGRGRATGKLIGQDADCVVVPVRDPEGALVAVECLSERRDGTGKFFRQSFGPKSQGWLVLGDDRDPHIPRYAVEGWATGAKMLEHLQGRVTVYIAFGAGRLWGVAEEVERRWPGSEVFICEEAVHA